MNIKMSLALTSFALILEAQFGYPDWLFRIIKHPVTHIGAIIGYAERRLNRPGIGFFRRRILGLLTLVCVLLVTIALAALLQIALLSSPDFSSLDFSALGVCLAALIGSSLIAQKSLYTHVEAVAKALEQPASAPAAIEAGRQAVAHIVGRDVTKLDRSGVARAAIESLAENFSDAVIAPAFYLALGGLPGGFLYKAINTADSMTGHKTPRYLAYGFCAAKLDDLVNWPAARLCVLWIWLAALFLPEVSQQGLWRVVRKDARSHPSPNSGWPEAAFAGALGLKLGGPRAYAGQTTESQWIGEGRDDCGPRDIRRALTLYLAACIMHGAGVALLTLFLIARF
jgi:adenosylcobinamide-phosphate synthase